MRADDRGRVHAVDGTTPEDATARAAEEARARGRLERSRLEMVLGYAEATGCRRRFLLGYFGEPYEAPCGSCDVCAPASGAGSTSAEDTVVDGVGESDGDRPAHPAATSYPAGALVRHSEWGDGTVMSEEGDRITVLFDSMGYRTLSLAAVADQDLLTAREGDRS
ncbi:DUF3553 domain-containing protein [Streptomyces sp. NPDC102394]|uniref:DUF3553 domain-containing protein n=1 Tax=Streptomyces sp. NPDC102394 TaxID=3366167 RepID=UPI00380BAEC5